MKPLLLLFIGLFAMSSLSALYFHDELYKAEQFMTIQSDMYQTAADSIRTLNREISYLQEYKVWHDQTTAKIAEIRSLGYKPEKLLIALIYRRAKSFTTIPVDSLFQIAKMETSYGSNNKKGMFGEEGWAQFTEETLRHQILFFEGDTTGFKMKNYKDNITVTDWVFTTYMYAKMHKAPGKQPSWSRDWNSGEYMKEHGTGGN